MFLSSVPVGVAQVVAHKCAQNMTCWVNLGNIASRTVSKMPKQLLESVHAKSANETGTAFFDAHSGLMVW